MWAIVQTTYISPYGGPFTCVLILSFTCGLIVLSFMCGLIVFSFTWALCPSYILYLVLRVTLYVGPLSIIYILFSLTCGLLRGPFVHHIYFI